MASRDVLGLLNGLRKVATAFYSEAGSELQQVASSNALRSLTESLWQCTCGGEEQGKSSWNDDLGALEFPDWDTFGKADPFAKFAGLPEDFPSVNSTSMAYPYTLGFSGGAGGGGGASLVFSHATPTSTDFTDTGSSRRPPLNQNKPGFPPFGKNSPNRGYHSSSQVRHSLSVFSRQRPKVAWVHTSDPPLRKLHMCSPSSYSNDSIIGSGEPQTTRERSESNTNSSTQRQPKVRPKEGDCGSTSTHFNPLCPKCE